MDRLTLLGIIIALFAIVGGQYLDGGTLEALINLPALLIVLGGTLGAVMLQTPGRIFKRAMRIVLWVFKPPKASYEENLSMLMEWSKKVRKYGLISLEQEIANVDDHFIKKGVDLLISGCDKEVLRSILEIELETLEIQETQAADVFDSMGGYAPTIGIIGAVLGLIHVMSALSDPSQVGTGIAVAFVATIYGVGFANLLFLPIANKLKTIIYNRLRMHEMIMEGLISIAEGDSPMMIEMKLIGFSQMNLKSTLVS